MRRSSYLVMASLAVLSIGVAACGSSGKSPAANGTTVPSGPKGTLSIGTYGDVQSFDPAKAQLSSGIYINVPYDTLLTQNRAGKLEADLATGWSEPNTQTWDFTLRSGVRFTDGTPFNSAAVEANIFHMKNTAGPNAASFADVSSVDTPTPTSVSVHFSSPDPAFATDMSTTLGAMASPKAITAGTLASDPVGTGGWIYDASASQPGVKYVFNANPNYWNKSQQLVQTVDLDVYTDNNARVDALETGAVDMIDALLPTQVAGIKAAGDQIVSNPDQVMLMFIGDRAGKLVPALASQQVREALNLAINRSAFEKTVDAGLGDSASTIYAPGSAWYDAANASLVTYNVAKAKQLLADAGYPNGFTMSAPVFATTEAQNEAIAEQLAQIGVTLKLVTVPPGGAGPAFAQQKFPVVFGPVSVGNPFDFWSSFVRQGGTFDPFDISTSAINSIAEQAAATTNAAKQKADYGAMEAEILKEGLFITLGHAPILAAAGPKVKGDLYLIDGERTVRPQGISVG